MLNYLDKSNKITIFVKNKNIMKCDFEKILKRCDEIHDRKYDYSKAKEPMFFKDKIEIICPIHGSFWQRLINHYQGSECPKCALEAKTYNLEKFIEKAHQIHGDKYDYSKISNYVNGGTKVCIICHKKDENGKEHGEFWQSMNCHVGKKQGCPKCSHRNALSNEEFIEKAKNMHGDKYDYSHINYINAHTPISIICPKHGEFIQTPANHLQGRGCPKCNHSRLEEDLYNFLIQNNIEVIEQFTFENFKKRSYDFYLPKYNTLIECQGEQHFIPTFFSNNQTDDEISKRFKLRQTIDKEKFDNAIYHKFKIIYFTNHYLFHKINKNVDININFYKDKLVFEDKDKLLEKIKGSSKID